MKTILVPLDLSDASLAALDHATTLAKGDRATLHLLYVDERVQHAQGAATKSGAAAHVDRLVERDAVKALQQLATIASRLRRRGFFVEVSTLNGRPAEQILKMAKERRMDLIVMGTHGRTGLRHLLMGSVAEAVMRSAACPVFTLRAPATSKRTKAA